MKKIKYYPDDPNIKNVAMTPDQKFIVVTYMNEEIGFYDSINYNQLDKASYESMSIDGYTDLYSTKRRIFSSCGQYILTYVNDLSQQQLQIFDLKNTSSPISEIFFENPIIDATFSPTEQTILTCDKLQDISLWDYTAKGKITTPLAKFKLKYLGERSRKDNLIKIQFSPNGKFILVEKIILDSERLFGVTRAYFGVLFDASRRGDNINHICHFRLNDPSKADMDFERQDAIFSPDNEFIIVSNDKKSMRMLKISDLIKNA